MSEGPAGAVTPGPGCSSEATEGMALPEKGGRERPKPRVPWRDIGVARRNLIDVLSDTIYERDGDELSPGL